MMTPAWLALLAQVARIEAMSGGAAGREWAELAAELRRQLAAELPDVALDADPAVVERAYAVALALGARPGPARHMAAWVATLAGGGWSCDCPGCTSYARQRGAEGTQPPDAIDHLALDPATPPTTAPPQALPSPQ